MSLLTYVASYEEVRALLGVEDEELPDARISLRVFLRSLEEGLNEIDISVSKASGTLRTEFLEVSQIANETRTAEERRLFDNVQAYCAYHVACDIAGALPQFSPKTITDGKAMVQRHADSPYKMVLAALESGKSKALSRLVRAYSDYLVETLTPSTSEPISYFVVSTPDSDPVTGT
jgi:hypothetical protein